MAENRTPPRGVPPDEQEMTITQLVKRYESNIIKALPTHVKPERILSVIRTAITSNLGLRDCSPMSILAGIVASSRLGLELDPVLGQAYLVPRWNKNTRQMEASFQIGYQGMLELSQRAETGIIIRARLVREYDRFDLEFTPDPQLSHKIDITRSRGQVIAAYTYVKYTDGRVDVFEPMTIDEALSIRDRFAPHERCKACYNKRGERENCQACGGTGQSDTVTGPWLTDEDEMVRKTCLRRNWKWLPKSAEMLDAQRIENRIDAGESPQTVLLDLPADKPGSAEESENLKSQKIHDIKQQQTQQQSGSATPTQTQGDQATEPSGQNTETQDDKEHPIVEVTDLPDEFSAKEGDRVRLPDGKVRRIVNGGWKRVDEPAPTQDQKPPVSLPRRK